jgi:uncharacterized protein (DUF433 family)
MLANLPRLFNDLVLGLNSNAVVKSEILGGTSVFVRTRVSFRNLIDSLERSHSLDEFLAAFPTVSREQAIAALAALPTVSIFTAGRAEQDLDRCLKPFSPSRSIRSRIRADARIDQP